jgi:hypothetical protein
MQIIQVTVGDVDTKRADALTSLGHHARATRSGVLRSCIAVGRACQVVRTRGQSGQRGGAEQEDGRGDGGLQQ